MTDYVQLKVIRGQNQIALFIPGRRPLIFPSSAYLFNTVQSFVKQYEPAGFLVPTEELDRLLTILNGREERTIKSWSNNDPELCSIGSSFMYKGHNLPPYMVQKLRTIFENEQPYSIWVNLFSSYMDFFDRHSEIDHATVNTRFRNLLETSALYDGGTLLTRFYSSTDFRERFENFSNIVSIDGFTGVGRVTLDLLPNSRPVWIKYRINDINIYRQNQWIFSNTLVVYRGSPDEDTYNREENI